LGQGADTLFALIILLEANGAFLLKLPERFHGEFAEPLMEHMEGLECTLSSHADRENGVLANLDRLQQAIGDASAHIEESRRELREKLKAAAASIDAKAIAHSVGDVLEASILYRLNTALKGLDRSTEQAIRASQSVNETSQTWKKLQVRGTFGAAIAFAGLLAASILCWGWWQMENHYRTRLAAHVTRLDSTDSAYRQLLWLGVSIYLTPQEDSAGKNAPDEYTMIIDHAESATIQSSDFGQKAVVSLKAKPLYKQSEQFREQAEKLQIDLKRDSQRRH
jgi:hypothetical protein